MLLSDAMIDNYYEGNMLWYGKPFGYKGMPSANSLVALKTAIVAFQSILLPS